MTPVTDEPHSPDWRASNQFRTARCQKCVSDAAAVHGLGAASGDREVLRRGHSGDVDPAVPEADSVGEILVAAAEYEDRSSARPLTLPDGTVAKVATIDGFVLYAVPSRFVRGSGLFRALRAFDAGGKQIDQRGVGRSW
jgi:hypothetical protein